MGFTIEQGLMLVLLIASTIAVSVALPYANCNTTHPTRSQWVTTTTGNMALTIPNGHSNMALSTYLYDTLVFKYDPPTPNTFPHNVYLLPNYESFIKCDFTNAQKVANETQGTGEGFEFVLEKPWRPHCFACAVRNGLHCLNGTMRFFVIPIFPLV